MGDATLPDELKRYVRFDESDAARLRAFYPHVAPHFARIVREFYERIREHEGAHAVFTDEAQMHRLERSLARWLDRLCLGPHDEAYFREISKIGTVHVRVGLPQRYMFAAMALIRVELERIADQTMGSDAPAVREAVTRLLDIELATMLHAYDEHFVARLQHLERMSGRT